MTVPTISSVVAQMSSLVDAWRTYITQVRSWLAGTATGGPGSDGSYPLTDDLGNTVLVPSPAAQASRVDAVVGSAQSYATEAGISAGSATTSAMNASTSEINAASHRDDAQTSANTAEMYATAAGNSAASALSSKTSALNSASAAATSASSLNQAVTDSQASAASAAASAQTATTKAADASSSASEAQSWALTAQTYATGLLHYMPGGWDASTGAFPTNPTEGDFWKITVAGTVDGELLSVGDQIIWSGSGWDHIDNTDSVTSVAGRVGAITLSIADVGGLSSALDGKQTALGYTPVDRASADIQGTTDSRITFSIDGGRRGLLAVAPSGVGSFVVYTSDGGTPTGQLDVGTGGMKYGGGFTLNCTSGTDVLAVNTPGSTPAGSFVQITSPGSLPGLVAQFGTTNRSDLAFGPGYIRLAASSTTAAATREVHVNADGTLSLSNANATTLTQQPRIFVQSTDPGAAAADGDLWFW